MDSQINDNQNPGNQNKNILVMLIVFKRGLFKNSNLITEICVFCSKGAFTHLVSACVFRIALQFL